MKKDSSKQRIAFVAAEEFSEWMSKAEPLPAEWVWLDRLSHGFLGQLTGRGVDTLVCLSLKDAFFDQIFVWDTKQAKAALVQLEAWISSMDKTHRESAEFYLYQVKASDLSFPLKKMDQLDDAVIWEALNFQDMPLIKPAGI